MGEHLKGVEGGHDGHGGIGELPLQCGGEAVEQRVAGGEDDDVVVDGAVLGEHFGEGDGDVYPSRFLWKDGGDKLVVAPSAGECFCAGYYDLDITVEARGLLVGYSYYCEFFHCFL